MEFYKKPSFYLLLFSFLIFLPLSLVVFHMSFTKITEPHVFVILIFSASLAFLLALVALFGLFINFIYPKFKKKEN